jgi:hypothetical protein
MRLSKQFYALALAALIPLKASTSLAASVLHQGVAFSSNPGSGSTTYLHHNSNNNGSGNIISKPASSAQGLAYDWAGMPGFAGSTLTFGASTGVVSLDFVGHNEFAGTLLLGTTGTSNNQLTIGSAVAP